MRILKARDVRNRDVNLLEDTIGGTGEWMCRRCIIIVGYIYIVNIQYRYFSDIVLVVLHIAGKY